MADSYRLGPALLQTSDDGTAHAPDTFRSALLRALDCRSRVAVALTCTAGLRWMLTEWSEAALHLAVRPAGAAKPDDSVLRRLHAARNELSLRGDLPVTLTVKQRGDGPKGQAFWPAVFKALGSGQARAHLSLTLQIQRLPATLLRHVGSAFPGLSTLSLGSASGSISALKLPPPASLPALRHVTIHRVSADSQTALWPSVAAYLPQLTSLTITEQPEDVRGEIPPWATAVFRPAHPSNTLTHLSLPCSLGSPLVGLLQKSAPPLEHLTVTELCRRPDHDDDTAGVLPVCSWRTLVLTDREAVHRPLQAWLPLPADGKLVVDVSGHEEEGAMLWLCDEVSVDATRVHFILGECGCNAGAPHTR